MKKILLWLAILALCMNCLGAFANYDTYLELDQIEMFEFSDNFDNYVGNQTYTGANVSLDENWRTSNASESSASFDSIARGFENGKLKIATNTNSVSSKYTTLRQKDFPAVVLQKDCTGLTGQQLIKVTAQKSHISDMWGIRFMTHDGANGTLNYYTLFFGGMYTTGYNTQTNTQTMALTWGLYKSTNGDVATLVEKERKNSNFDHIDGYMGTGTADLTISIIDNKITWTLDYTNGNTKYTYNETYTDAKPFDVSDKATTVHFYVAGSNNASRCVTFDNFTLANAVPYITSGEPDNVIYQNIAEGKSFDSNQTLDFGKDFRIRKLLCGESENIGKVLVSKDRNTWYLLAEEEEFTNGTWLNNKSDDYFRYLAITGTAETLNVLTDISEYEGLYTEGAIRLYPRVGGVDYFGLNDNKLSTSNDGIIKINGNMVTPTGIGSAVIVASDGVESTQITVHYKSGIYSYKADFTNMGTEKHTGANIQFDKAWRSKTEQEGKMGYNDDAAVGYGYDQIFVQARGLKDGDSYARYPRWAETVPAVVFNEDHSSLTQNQVIKMRISKTSGTETSGVRFMVHDNGNSYYALLFPGKYALGGLTDKDNYYSSWELIKCEGGQYTMLAKQNRSDNREDVAGGFLGFAAGDLTIEYVNGKISWNMSVHKNNSELYEWSGEYVDENPYLLEGNDSTVWLISGLYSGTDPSRGSYFDNIQIASYVPYITVDEPDTVLYQDIIENQSAQNNVYTLDNARSIRRLIASDVEDNFDVYASKDGNVWYKLASFDKDGEYLNNVYGDEFRYVKTEGAGKVAVLVEVSEEAISIMPEQSATLYPYVNGALYSNVECVEETGCVVANKNILTGKSAIKNNKIIVRCGNIEIPVKVTVPLLEAVCNVTTQGNDAVIDISVPDLKNVDAQIAVLFFNADHSMNSMQVFDKNFADGTETIVVKDYYTSGKTAKLIIWNNDDNAAAYTKAVVLK